MSSLLRDIRYSIRSFLQNPGFTAVAVLSLALGIGANTTIFSVLNTILLRPLPVKDHDRLVVLSETELKEGRRRNPAFSTFLEWENETRVFEGMARVNLGTVQLTLTGAGAASRIRRQAVGPNFFSLLGVAPLIGRTFEPEAGVPQAGVEDFTHGETSTAVISHGLWQRHFGGAPDILGQTVAIEGQKKTIIGVMPPGFWVTPWTNVADVWLAYTPVQSPSTRWFSVIARLKSGATLEQAQAEMDILAEQLEQSSPEANKGWGVTVLPLHEVAVGEYQRSLSLLLGAVGFVLLIACANVANLLVARASSRQKEIGVRASLGASRLRLIRQLLTESMLLALLAGFGGILLAVWGIKIFVALAPEWFARAEEIGIDLNVLGFTLAVCLLTGILFGLTPALRASKPDLNESLKEGGGRSLGGAPQRRRSLLVVSEVALALVLLVGAGLMINSFVRLQNVDPGFNPDSLLTADIHLAGPKYWDFIEGDKKRVTPQVALFYQQVLQGAGSLPGVESAGMISNLAGGMPYPFRIVGRPVPDPRQQPRVNYAEVTPGFFRTMQIPLLKGRHLTERDTQASPWVVVINEALARRFFPNENPIGKLVYLTMSFWATTHWIEEGRPREIVGVVGDMRHWGPRQDPPPVIYGSYRQHAWEYPGGLYWVHINKNLVLRTASDPMSFVGAVRRVVAEVDKDQAVSNIRTMEQTYSQWVAPQRFWMRLFGIFAGLAVLLAAIGIYGVMSYSVSQRTHEIGVRVALGAQPPDVLKLVLRQGLKLALIGVALGILGALALTRLIARFLYGVTATDPATFTVVTLVLVGVAMLASYIPARRASRLAPMEALRHE